VKRTVDVEVAGQRLAIRSDEGPEYIAQLAALVDAQVRELTGDRRGNPTRALALVAIQLADQLLREQDLHDRLRRDLARQLAAIEEADVAHRRSLEALTDGPATAEADR
jgi:cell division protein ZapA (FtsZ GTPase activity inhibitor)